MGRQITYITLILSWAWVASAQAQQVATNITPTAGAGSLDTTVTQAGNSFDITGGRRPNDGPNLFHSFGEFSVGAVDRANFANDTGLATHNILSRVTGGSRSDIFGTIKTTGFPGADLFLLNPAGIVFGPSARLNVQGSFHASTGDFIRLADGRRFDALPSPNDTLLTTKPPQAFGFLGDQAASISFQGSPLTLPEGETLSVIGGDIDLTGGARLRAPGGRMNVASVASAGEVRLKPNGLDVDSFDRLGKIEMNQGSIIDTSGEGGGSVFIRGGEFVMDRSEVRSVSHGSKGGVVSVEVDRLELQKARIGTATSGSGRAGDVLVEADRVSLADRVPLPVNASLPVSNLPGGIGSVAFGSGAAGAVTVKARDLQVRKGAAISTLAFGPGRAGNVLVEADRVSLSGDQSLSPDDLPGGIGSATFGSGAAGTVTVKAGELEVRNRAVIATTTRGSGSGGNVRVEADRVSLFGDLSDDSRGFFPTGIIAAAQGPTAVRTGKLTVKAGDLKVRNGARIVTTTEANSASGGDVLVEADRVSLSGRQSDFLPGGIGSVAFGNGASGAVTVKAGELEVRNRAVIGSTTAGSGRGGDVLVEADRVFLSGDGAPLTGIGVLPLPLDATVKGTVTIKAGELQVRNGAGIGSTTTGSARGGDIFVKADSVLLSGDGSPFDTGIFARAEGTAPGSGGGGDLTVNAGSLMVKEGATQKARKLAPSALERRGWRLAAPPAAVFRRRPGRRHRHGPGSAGGLFLGGVGHGGAPGLIAVIKRGMGHLVHSVPLGLPRP